MKGNYDVWQLILYNASSAFHSTWEQADRHAHKFKNNYTQYSEIVSTDRRLLYKILSVATQTRQ